MDADARWSKFSQSVRPILDDRTTELYAALNRIEAIGQATPDATTFLNPSVTILASRV